MNAFICASPVQIIRAIQMKTTLSNFQEDADLFIVKVFDGADIIAHNIVSLNLFHNVESIEISTLEKPLFWIVYNRYFLKAIKRNNYQKLISFNVSGKLIDAIYNLNKNDPKFEYYCVEDCPSIYRIPEYPPYSKHHPNYIFGLRHAYFHIKNWYTSCPDFIDVPKSYHTEKKLLPPIDYMDDKIVSLLNKAFGYKEVSLLANADILFMDEGHYQDGVMVDDADYKLYMKIIGRYPTAHFLMKMHPRTQNNRYLGKIQIMDKSYIPWEVYAMNRARNCAKDLIQISICCGTMFSDKLMFNYEGTKILTAPLFYDKIRNNNDNAPRVCEKNTANIEHFRELYEEKGQFIVTYTEDELFGVLDKKLNNG